MKHLVWISAGVIGLAACASQPAAGPSAADPAPASSGAIDLKPKVATEVNISANSRWVAEERLLPADPILALIEEGGSVEQPAGLSVTCNPANGSMRARLARQPAERSGQSAVYTIALGRSKETVEGRFEANRSGGTDFVFPMDAVQLRTLGQFDQVVFETDAGEAQWAFVREPSAGGEARYVASLRDLTAETSSYMQFCNPK